MVDARIYCRLECTNEEREVSEAEEIVREYNVENDEVTISFRCPACGEIHVSPLFARFD
jgi:predicted RNA-binding Zn-ribbon protein involved in translation (DUF1610 family)